MTAESEKHVSRRRFLKTSVAAGAGSTIVPALCLGKIDVKCPVTRRLGSIDFEVTTLGLGGQAALQWTPPGVKPEEIVIKAIGLGINYFDTSNVYGPSQLNYGKAFRAMHLVPGVPSYNESLRRSIFLASKTFLRYAKGARKGVFGKTDGPPDSKSVDDLKRTLSQIFGDGEASYPDGAYVDLLQIHGLLEMNQVDAIYEGLENPDPKAEYIGALAALRDYRDGTNLTGLNPKEEKLIRHIGITGHAPPVLMECLQRDKNNLIETMLVPINANDLLYFNNQHNVIPVAAAKRMGIIAMKVFADGAMYSKPAEWSTNPSHVIHSVGSESLPSRLLVEYTLSTPGVSTAIIGIGHIDSQSEFCQLEQNLTAAQISPNGLSENDRKAIEEKAAQVKNGKTNWFQLPTMPLGVPRRPAIVEKRHEGQRIIRITWQTAYAADKPIRSYEIWRNNRKVGEVQHKPQVSKEPFAFEDTPPDYVAPIYRIITVDAAGRRATSIVPL